MKVEKYPIGTEVYYSLEDYDSGEDIIYKGTISKIDYHDFKIKDNSYHMKMYQVNKGLGMQCNAFYTLEELYKMANRLQYLTKEYYKEKAIEKDI